ncbi:hypothetical protein E3J59_06095 [Candidatus Aerophobetes bacterium]|uniref:Alcohol dehydrogenase-like N-terminal domain-containing protein n=1 Tax=Aerophobetes bacterium TaxID=2030807 RepID=A0A523UM61_UNCAE|nr:MAG: hypothetical protein E3J59_06095 [Candidatus Aerophobetes bacterium]
MLALMKLKKGKGFVELREVEEPKIKDDEVLIQVIAAGICGTDIHIYHDDFPYRNMEWDRAVFKAIRIIFSFSSSLLIFKCNCFAMIVF